MFVFRCKLADIVQMCLCKVISQENSIMANNRRNTAGYTLNLFPVHTLCIIKLIILKYTIISQRTIALLAINYNLQQQKQQR